MHKETYRFIRNANTRRRLFLEKIKEYEDTVLVNNESLLPYIHNGRGIYDSKKANLFMEEFLKDIQTAFTQDYIDAHAVTNNPESNDMEEDDMYGLDLDLEKLTNGFFRKYLYCVVHIAAANPNNNVRNFTPNFDSIIRYASCQYHDEIALQMAYADCDLQRIPYISMEGIFGPGMWLRCLLTNKKATEELKEKTVEENKKDLSEFSRYIWNYSEQGNPSIRAERFYVDQRELDEEDLKEETGATYLMWSFNRDVDEDYEMIDQMAKELSEIKAAFSNDDQFVAYFDEVTKDLIKMNSNNEEHESWEKNMQKILTTAVDLFAAKHFNTILLNDEVYFTSISLIDLAKEKVLEIDELNNKVD